MLKVNKKVLVQIIEDIGNKLSKFESINGLIGTYMVERNSGVILGRSGNRINKEKFAKSCAKILSMLNFDSNCYKKDSGNKIRDVLFTFDNQYHMIKPSLSDEDLILYFLFDINHADLAKSSSLEIIRKKILIVEKKINFDELR